MKKILIAGMPRAMRGVHHKKYLFSKKTRADFWSSCDLIAGSKMKKFGQSMI
jgi:hypothetical protein